VVDIYLEKCVINPVKVAIAEFQTSTPDGSFEFEEVPSYLALHNLSLPDYTSESDSDQNSQSSSLTVGYKSK
jgi:hypothetical protein